MVDFNTETLAQKTPQGIINIVVLEYWNNYNLAVIDYMDKEARNFTHNTFITLKSRLYGLFNVLRSALKKRLSEEEFNFLDSIPDLESYEEVLEAYDIINNWLYSINLAKVDRVKVQDWEDVLGQNVRSGFG